MSFGNVILTYIVKKISVGSPRRLGFTIRYPLRYPTRRYRQSLLSTLFQRIINIRFPSPALFFYHREALILGLPGL